MKLSELDKNTYEGLKIERSISLALKQALIAGSSDQNLLSDCILDHDGVKKVDFFSKEILLATTLIKYYTNIDLSEDEGTEEVSMVDMILDSGLADFIVEQCSDAKKFVDLFEKCVQQEIEIENSPGVMLNRNIARLIEKIPNEKVMKKLVSDLPKMINKIEPDRLDLLRGVLPEIQKQLGIEKSLEDLNKTAE